MITISLCMIVKNEEDVIIRCLESVKGVADEIILVDTGSSDNTKALAAPYVDAIYDFSWIDDFSAARNYTFSKATKDYCMWIDADDILTAENRNALIQLKDTLPPETDVVMLRYNTAFDEAGNPTFSYYRERIVRNSSAYRWQGRVHEVIPPSGRVVYADIAVTHHKLHAGDTDRNLRIYRRQIAQGESLSPRDQFYFARELYYHKLYEEAAAEFRRFLAEGGGWLENNIESCRFLAYCLYAQGKDEEALSALLHSLIYDSPRAECCCDIGRHFLERNACRQAVFWYELALNRPRDDTTGAFVNPDCYGFLPCIQLCVCWDRLGNVQQAAAYNERAGSYKPESPAYLYNREYFRRKAEDNGSFG